MTEPISRREPISRPAPDGGAAPDGGPAEALIPAVVSEQLATLGPYFAAGFHDASQEPEAPWRSLAELTGDPAVIQERVAGVRAFLAAGTGQDPEAVEARVAASVVHLGLVARVVSPLVALRVGHGWRGSVGAADLRWQPGLASTFPLSISESALERTGSNTFTGGVIAELETAVAPFGVNRHILRGNVASALAGAVKTLAAARPELADRASAMLQVVLAEPVLHGSAGHRRDGTFRRRSCCLIYRAAPAHDGALCGDCALRD
ncbi:MAG: (2Fe-2S)-binding protein [Catenulispora sp.]|nr:(2Fe-2S)-binding protein [Catenulispora sp.]